MITVTAYESPDDEDIGSNLFKDDVTEDERKYHKGDRKFNTLVPLPQP